jgi:outer membrane protein assembly factor BamB
LLWRQAIGSGWSGFAVAGDYAVTQEQRGDEEHTSCYALRSGEAIWTHVERVRHDDVLGGPGPRATPAIVGDIVYSFGATGILNALDLRTGDPLWRHDMLELAAANRPIYGFSSSPVVRNGRLVVAVGAASGRSVWAFDSLSGETLWSSGDASAGYATPAHGTLAGTEQWIVFNEGSVNGYAAEGGDLLWSTAWPQPTEETAQPKILSDDRLLVSSGYGVGARLYQLSSKNGSIDVELLWESIRLKAKFSDFVIREGNVYGLDDGILTCVSIATGERVWKGGRYGHGQLLLVGDKLLIQAEGGDLALVAATPHAHQELGRMTVFDRKGWNHPALAGSVLLIRNDQEVAAFELHEE